MKTSNETHILYYNAYRELNTEVRGPPPHTRVDTPYTIIRPLPRWVVHDEEEEGRSQLGREASRTHAAVSVRAAVAT
jgi:hypothetical protein